MNNHAFNNPGQGIFRNDQGMSAGNNPRVQNQGQFQPNSPSAHSNQAPAPNSGYGQGYAPQGGHTSRAQNMSNQQAGSQQGGGGRSYGPQGGNQSQGEQYPYGQNYGQQSSTEDDRDYRMIAAYGKRSALQFKPTGTRVSDSRKFSHQTIMIEGAMRVDPNNPQNRAYNWGDKINVQVTAGELPLVIGVLLGMAPSCHFGNHGKNNDKAFNLEFQQDKFFVSVMQKDKNAVGVAVPLVDAMQIGHLALSQYLCNYPGLDSETAMRDISRLCNQLNQANKFPLKPSK